MNNSNDRHIEGLIFVALMFIGAGLGLLFGRPDVGGALGMGFGFIVMALIRYYNIRVRPEEKLVSIRSWAGALILGCIGVIFILVGVSLLLNIQYILRYISSAILILLGLIFISLAFKVIYIK